MTRINIVYDDALDDSDIIAIPDEILSKIEMIGQEFLRWLPSADANDSDYWIIQNGRNCSCCETDGFIKWLNSNYCSKTEKAYVVERNTRYCPQYRTIEF